MGVGALGVVYVVGFLESCYAVLDEVDTLFQGHRWVPTTVPDVGAQGHPGQDVGVVVDLNGESGVWCGVVWCGVSVVLVCIEGIGCIR